MGKLGGFLEISREEAAKRPVEERIKDWKELYKPYTDEYLLKQAARCMDCGVPFCHYSCPVSNNCPEWNDFVHKGQWKEALDILQTTNNFPEFTGRVCPALCEGGCVLGLNDKSVTIKNIELNIVEKGWENGWIKPMPPKNRTGKKVAVVGSGPAGLAAAQQLNRAGHEVTCYERDFKAGGILTYGIPDYKIEKWVVERRVSQIADEGVEFVFNCNVGVDVTVDELEAKYDAVLLAGGSKMARDLPVFGRELKGINYAMDYLIQQNEVNAGKEVPAEELINAKDKNVVIIGGGDTGADCVGTAMRQGAKNIYQIELLEKPPLDRPQTNPWPNYPQVLKVNTAHEEAEMCLGGKCELGEVRQWSILTKEFVGDENGNVKQFKAARVEWVEDENGKKSMKEVPNSEFTLDADLVFLAIGFIHPEHEGLVNELGVELDGRGNVAANTQDFQTSKEKVFAAGDMRKGQSLVVWAIAEGREAAASIDKYLMEK
jgi:glutamate synthase (NADPH/NADH) small chain